MQSQTTVPQINPVEINGVKVYPFATKDQLVDYLLSYPGILVAINAEKIINATDQTRAIINANIGYCDGVGAVWAMSRRGHKHLAKIASVSPPSFFVGILFLNDLDLNFTIKHRT